MAAPSEENLICDKFNLEALTVNQVKSFKAQSLSVTCGRSVFSSGSPVSSTNKTDHHNITEILLKVALNTINQPNFAW
jgi:hypothetical protein